MKPIKVFVYSFLISILICLFSYNVIAQRPNMPGVISGPRYGVCGLTYVYSIKPVLTATGYTWTVNGGTLVSGQGDTTILVTFPVSSQANYISVTADNSSGSSDPRSMDVHGKPAKAKDIVSIPNDWCAGTNGVRFFADISSFAGLFSLNWNWTPVAAAGNPSGASTNLFTLDWYQQTNNAVVRMFASNSCGTAIKYYITSIACREAGYETTKPEISMDISLYPNPTDGNFNLEFNSFSETVFTIHIIDPTGRTVMADRINAINGINVHSVDLSTYARGIYSVIMNGNNFTGVNRISLQ